MDALDGILDAGDVVAVLGRDVTVRLIDISASGCQLESSTRVGIGSTGSLTVTFEGREYTDHVRVIRCSSLEGAGSGYRIGAEFLWATVPPEQSLRRMVTRLHAGAITFDATTSLTRN